MREVFQEILKFYDTKLSDKYLVQTRSQTKSSGVKLSEVYGIEKDLDPHVKPGRQRLESPVTDIRLPISKPRIGQGRAGTRRKAKIVLPLQTSTPEATKSLPVTMTQSQEMVPTEHTSTAQTGI